MNTAPQPTRDPSPERAHALVRLPEEVLGGTSGTHGEATGDSAAQRAVEIRIVVNIDRATPTWSKRLTLFREGQGTAPVLLQFYVSLSTTDSKTRSPTDHAFAGQRALLIEM